MTANLSKPFMVLIYFINPRHPLDTTLIFCQLDCNTFGDITVEMSLDSIKNNDFKMFVNRVNIGKFYTMVKNTLASLTFLS